ncbi:hypothetical protein Si005_00007 [Streptococcus infantarius subsp. infantarius]|nr:hypothetical protein [Streptococcus infantarius subsp. infantarius]
MKTNGIPKIRFKGFTDDWEQRKLGELVTFSKGSGYSKGDLLKEGTPIILYGRLYTKYETVISNVDTFVEPKGKSVFSKGGEVIVPGSGETAEDISIASVVEESGVLLGGDLNIITPPKEINSAFLAISISNGKPHKDMAKMAQGKSVVHLHNSDLAKIDFPFPIYEEQCRISNQFAELDNLITLHQRKCEQTKELKKFMLQKMFPKKGEKNPEIRFPGFTDDWEQRKLSELYNKNTEKNEELISYDKTISIATMTYKNGGNGASDKSLKAYKVLRVGDLAFEGHTNKKFKYGRFVLNDIGTGIMSPRFSTLRPIQCMPISFWKYYIHYEPIMQKILVNSTKAGTMMNELVIPEFLKQSILVPSMNEQQKIGEYFSNLDRLITLHQRKCEQLKELKKFMLQNMFPKKG